MLRAVAGGSSAVVGGPSGAPTLGTVTDTAIVRWDGTTGALVKNSVTTIDDTTGAFSFNTNTGLVNFGTSKDLILSRGGAAVLIHGAADAAAPVAQTLGVQSVVAGTANTAGANFTIAGSKSTGSAAGGSIIFQTAAAGGAGSGQNALATALTINSAKTATFAAGVVASAAAGYSSDGANVILSTGQTTYLTLSQTALLPQGTGYTLGSATTGYTGLWLGTSLSAGLTGLFSDAANTLALRNSTTAQRMVFYNTYTDASNNEFFMVDWQSVGGRLKLATIGNGTGSARQIWIGPNGSAVLSLATNNTERWQVDTSGHFLAGTDNTYDIGASGATRPRAVYVGTTGIFSAGAVTLTGGGLNVTASNFIGWTGRSYFDSPSDGVVRVANSATTDFTRLQFGGTTSSFPAIGPLTTTGGWGFRLPSAADTNGQSVNFQTITESTTIAAAATTDTTIQIPANAVVFGVSVRVTTVIPTAATFDYGVAGATARYGSAIAVAANTTNPGTLDGTRYYGSAISIRFTPNLQPAAATGVVRTTIHFYSITAPTS